MGDAKLTGKHIRPGEPKQYMEAPRDKDGKIRHYRTLDEELKVAKKPFYDGCPVYVLRGVHKVCSICVECKISNFSNILGNERESIKF